MIKCLLVAALGLPTIAAAQRGQQNYNQYRYENMQYDNSVLSVFSENGETFYLFLNGIKQNLTPQNKIRVEALPKYQNDLQIVFADRRTQPIRRMVNIADPVDGKAANLTLRVSRGRNGAMQLRFHRMTECDRNYHGPRDEYVMYYGKPQQVNTVTETTYMDPITGQWITETTTTTDNNQYYGNNDRRGNYQPYTPPAQPIQPAGPIAMDRAMFSDVKQSISSASFEETKLSTAKTILGSNYMTTDQVMEICQLFSFENTKVTFAKIAYGRTVDPQNYFKVASVFSFDSNKKALNDFISSGGR
ncbi:MAG: DUF4476 domain-containing protein [Taibaiella sp.]|nr:DUF4476 domain-containing protein [Taibaiella sp.]